MEQTKFSMQTWVCRSVVALKIYASMASMNWMFVEGLLLHTKLSGVFTEGPPFICFYAIGWGMRNTQRVISPALFCLRHILKTWGERKTDARSTHRDTHFTPDYPHT